MKIKPTATLLLLLAAVALAVSTGAGTAAADRATAGDRLIITKTATGDVTGNATDTITGDDYNAVKGRVLYGIVTTPGTGAQQPSAWTGSIDAASQGRILTIPTRSTTATEYLPGSLTVGSFPAILSGWTTTLTGIGDGDTVTIQYIFW